MQKPALKAAKETKKDFLVTCRALPVGAAPSAASTVPAGTSASPALKTASACNAEYKADKAALKAANEKKKDLVAACRALPTSTATPIGAAAPSTSWPPAPPPVAPQQTAASPTAPAARATAPTAATAPTGANQFAAEAGAKARCPSATFVWVNTKSKVYHFTGTKNYGNTKADAYMCESDATAAGDRASETEKHP